MNDHKAPSKINNYLVLEHKGSGVFGHTYRVKKIGNGNEEYALKWLKENAPRDAEKRFTNETWALKQLDHPAIPKYVDSGTFKDRPFLVMTLAKGESLGPG